MSGQHLLTIINQILDFSKIESGRLELERGPFDLADCIEEALQLVAPKVAGTDIELTYVLDDAMPRLVVGDAARLRQVLVNLLANAKTPGSASQRIGSIVYSRFSARWMSQRRADMVGQAWGWPSASG